MDPRRQPLSLILLLFLLGGATRAAAHTLVTGVELRDTTPPPTCSPALAAALSPRCLVIRSYGEDVLRIWSVRELSLTKAPRSADKVAFGAIAAGALVGVVEVSASFYDYRDQPVKLGLYTLRYGLISVESVGIGHARWRDALLMLPLQNDQDPTRVWPPGVLRALATAEGENALPRRMALFPTPEGRGPGKGEPPKLIANELHQPMLSFWIGDVHLNLVVAGSVFLGNQE